MLYAHAALRFCEGGKAEMDGLETLRSELKALQAKLPEAERSKLAGSASKPIWATVGHTAPRADREEWKKVLAALPSVEERDRDGALDDRILRGHEIVVANLEQLKRVVRLLVSSTFTDTNEERNMFLGDVMPALQELGRKLKLEVFMAEMRWGIRTEASEAHLTSEICMRELARCLRESVGISYVFIAAQKYGFRPFPRLIPEKLFTELLEKMADKDRTLLKEWFKLDKNALPVDDAGEEKEWEGSREFYGTTPGASGRCYVLQSQSKLADRKDWWPLFNQMQLMVGHIKEKAGKGCVVIRFLGTSPASSAVQPLLSSVCDQLRRCYGKDGQVPSDFKELKAYFRKAVAEWPSEEQPLTLFIDSVDQLDDSNAGRRLEWLRVAGLSPHVRLVVSTLPDLTEFRCLSLLKKGLGHTGEGSASSRIVEVETISEHSKVLTHLLELEGRTATADQIAAVDAAFQKRGKNDGAGTPLWLTIVAQFLALWTSYEAVKFEISPSVQGLIMDLFERLETTHGKHLVRAVLAFLTLCRQSGVSETEINHLLSLDDAVLADIYEWWVPSMRTCPPLVLTMLLAELAPYLSRRGDGSGQELLFWYHRQFWEAAAKYLFAESGQQREGFVSRQARHQQLADVFAGTWAGVAKPYSAGLSERVQRPQFCPGETAGDRMVPYQPLALEGRFDEGGASLLPNTRRIAELVHHATRAGDVGRAAEYLCSVEYVAAKFAVGQEGDLMREYAEAIEICGGSPSPEQQRLEHFKNFVGRHRALIRAQCGELAALPFQLAAQEPEVSQVWAAAERTEFTRRVEWPLRPQQIDPCLLTIGEHEGQVLAVAFSPCGKWFASGSSDTSIKICSAGTGEVKCTLTGHSGEVRSVAFSPDGTRVVSG
ncbi:hypothetical protein T484DRAFT_2027873, partial [Baffinella frigidus]